MLWIGTSKSWYKFNPKTEQIIPYSFGTDYLIAEENSGDLWIGKESGAIYKRDLNGRITNFYDSSGQWTLIHSLKLYHRFFYNPTP